MSYDLMVFDLEGPPSDRRGFMEWYEEQIQWNEEHGYDDPRVSTPALRAWFIEMIGQYPAMNGPYASDNADDPRITDYSIGNSAIYAAFAWSEAEDAFKTVFKLAEKHRVGFFKVSEPEGGVWTPGKTGGYTRVHGG
jgi:hypothetical protein